MRARSLVVRYAAGLAFAYLLTAAEVVAIVISVSRETVIEAQSVLSATNLIATVAIVIVGTVTVWLSGVAMVARALHRASEDTTTPRKPPNITRRQSATLLAPWALAAVVMIPLNFGGGIRVLTLIASAIAFGATATVCTGFLFTQRALRSLMVAATVDFEHAERAPGVRARLILMWTMCSALPGAGIVVLVMLRANGWIIQPDAPIETPVLVLALVAVVLGLRAMILVSSSISDPVHEVVDAMAEVERGRLGRAIDVYERSEIGQLQTGFNRMVAGLQERDRLRDLFGRHVGEEVVRRAVEEHESVSGDEREAAILFIDLVGSTQLAATRKPHEVAAVLNDFFRIVVAEVDKRNGLINKFQGDAALAVFGAPLRIDDPASAALATARALGDELRRLLVDFGIGVSAGPVFAGNIGAENRYEYTVVGDAVNEAARLADRAKDFDGRVLCSAAAIERTSAAERKCWGVQGSEMLRGRSRLTQISAPVK
ncbi:adenylate/guanylate cyclase domain-containing protein [Mycobacterium sp.]|jgi:adenylate cyclase|uniref:adenylate/guanylate cyclase domain-containing protein n=1 Tax=Mycobacterium sp. TaxID=1785 RepID=UPI002CF7DF04|nr:adenylate/guanylate cyclase domain-containing protein [Mycobacterium sp.]HTH84363.1 adenylate/guanylate cyclase domain-containing protein [Mycobacterium sp.]